MVGNKFGNLMTRVSISARKLAADQAMVSLSPYDQAIDIWFNFFFIRLWLDFFHMTRSWTCCVHFIGP